MAKTNKKLKESLKGMEKEELKKELATNSEALRAMHFKAEGSRSKNVKETKELKKQIARILTEINK